jgi:hypothetical protein
MTDTVSTLTANEIGRRDALKRFGYGQAATTVSGEALEREWALLAPDFLAQALVMPLSAMQPALRRLAEEHVRRRRVVDQLMQVCDVAHARIAGAGARPDLVEAYAVARDEFEEAVEYFAAHCGVLAKALTSA